MKRVLIVVIILFGLINTFFAKENSVKVNPQRPRGGEPLTVTFNAEGTTLAKADTVEMTVYLYSMKSTNQFGIEEAHSIFMKKTGNDWKAEIKTSAETDLVILNFDNYVVNENNDGKGYFIKFYNSDGSETTGSKLGYASCIGYWGTSLLGLKTDAKLAYDIFNEIFVSNAELKLDYLMQYFTSMNGALKQEESAPLILKELDALKTREDLKDENYYMIAYFYKKLKMVDKANEATDYAIKRYPAGTNAWVSKYTALRAEKDLEKQINLAIEMEKDFKDAGNENYYAGYLIAFGNLIKENKFNLLKDLLSKNSTLTENLRLVTTLLNNLLNENKELEFGATIAEKGVALSRKEMAKPLKDKVFYMTESQVIQNRKSTLGNMLFMYGDVLKRLNKKEDALKQCEEAFSLISLKDVQIDKLELYCDCLVYNKKYDKAKETIEDALKKVKANDKMKELLKEVYIQKEGSDKGFSEYLSALLNVGKSATIEKLRNEIIKEPAPQFTLKDLDGKEVSLSSLKGKIIVVDFWATWCGPCKASFPGMQKAVEKYSKNENVKFLFVDTWEQAADKTKNAADFIQQNKYTFHVLVDSKDEVVKSFNVQGVPTKFVVDKEGFIRFKKVGAPEGADAIVDEVSTMINLIEKLN